MEVITVSKMELFISCRRRGVNHITSRTGVEVRVYLRLGNIKVTITIYYILRALPRLLTVSFYYFSFFSEYSNSYFQLPLFLKTILNSKNPEKGSATAWNKQRMILYPVFSPISRAGNSLIGLLLIRSFRSNQMSVCERFAQIAQDK